TASPEETAPEPQAGAAEAPAAAASAAPAHDGFFTKDVIRHNMMFLIMLEAILMTGSADFQIGLQPLLEYINAPYKLIGFIQGLSWTAILGCIATPYITRHFPYKKWYYITVTSLWALSLAVLGIALVTSPVWNPSLFALTIVTLICVVFFNMTMGFTNTPHNEFIASCIPPDHRGRLFGISTALYGLVSLGVIAISRYLLEVIEHPVSFGFIFIMTCVIWLIGFGFASFAREMRTPVEKSPKPWTREMFRAFFLDKAYIRFVIFCALTHLTFMPLFVLIPNYGLREMNMPATAAADIAFISQIVVIVTSTPSGWLIDKFGPKRMLPISVGLIGCAYMFLFIVFTPLGIYSSMGLMKLALAVFYPCLTILSVSIPKPEDRAGHFSTFSIVGMLYFAAGPIIGGFVSDWIEPRTVVLIGSLLAFAFIPLTIVLLRVLATHLRDYY
ncbi:MAG TPA: MFS transporter, partial [Candidatus Sumerlaeota bacterium]|nr:MFS transporter [Candidatus Sumerlaeota bacterium]